MLERLPECLMFSIIRHCAGCIHTTECVCISFRRISLKVLLETTAQFNSHVLFVTQFRAVNKLMQRFALIDFQAGPHIIWQNNFDRDLGDASLLSDYPILYLAGGSHHSVDQGHVMPQNYSRRAELFNVETHKFTKLQSMTHSRRRCALAMSKNGDLISFGGHAGEYFAEMPLSKTIEIYKNGTWKTLHVQLPSPIWNAQTATVGHEIFIFGTSFQYNQVFTDDLHRPVFLCFNTSNHTFRNVRQTTTKRPWCSICSLFEKIYTIAGEGISSDTAEVYDIHTDTWSALPSLACPIQAVGASLKSGSFTMPLCSNGIVELWTFMHSGMIQIFNIRTLTWRIHSHRLPHSITPKPHIYGQTNVLQNALPLLPGNWKLQKTQDM